MYARFKALDEHTTGFFRLGERSGIIRGACVLLAHSGDSWFWLIGLGLLWQLGGADWRPRALTMLIGIVVTALVVMVIKFTVRRRRPEGEWGRIYRSTDPHSFPSGHAARSAMLAVLAVGSGPIWFALVLILWAPLVGLARIVMGVHYLSDIVAGAALGLVMGGLVLALI